MPLILLVLFVVALFVMGPTIPLLLAGTMLGVIVLSMLIGLVIGCGKVFVRTYLRATDPPA